MKHVEASAVRSCFSVFTELLEKLMMLLCLHYLQRELELLTFLGCVVVMKNRKQCNEHIVAVL